MTPPAPVPPADIGLYWTDEELFKSLEKIIHGSPLPDNVTADINPYHYMPSNLPDELWYFIPSGEKTDTELGYWKTKGDACEIFTNSAITGWRTTLEFYEGQAPHGRRNGWVMQEYRIIQKGQAPHVLTKDSRSLCRVFVSDGLSPDHELPPKQGAADIAGRDHFHSVLSTIQKTDITTGQGSSSECLEKKRDDEIRPLALADRLPQHPVENLHELYLLGGDYLELDDLVDPQSRSSSSDNSSCRTLTSDECFDSLELLRNLEDENQNQQRKDTCFKYSVSASVKPNEVVICPATLGSLIGSGDGSKSSVEGTQKPDCPSPSLAIEGKFIDKEVADHATKRHQDNEGTSNSRDMAASSSSHKTGSDGEKKALVGRMKKLKKTYSCLMPF